MDKNFQGLSDEELVEKFLCREDNDMVKTKIRDELFGRYYKRFDSQIRFILTIKEIPYGEGEEYYERVFWEIYERVFLISVLEEKLPKFDSHKGFFKGWFLKTITNEVRDWLKKLNFETELSNEETLKIITNKRDKEQSLDAPVKIKENEDGVTGYEVISSKDNLPEEILLKKEKKEEKELIHQAINDLTDDHRVIIRLNFIAYEQLEDKDIIYISKATGRPEEEVRKSINSLKDRLRGSNKFGEGENKKLQIVSLKLKIENLQRKAFIIKEELEAFDCCLGRIEEEIEGLYLKDIEEMRKRLVQEHNREEFRKKEKYEKKIDVSKNWIDIQLLNLKEILKRLRTIKEKRERILKSYLAGKYYVNPTYEDITYILDIEAGTVGSRINRAKEALWKKFTQMKKIAEEDV